MWWDPEFYFPATSRSPWTYNTSLYPNHTFLEVEAKVRQRGREYMQAMQSAKPDIVVLATYLASLPYDQTGGDRNLLPDSEYALLAGFVAGIIEVADARAQIIDGHEFGYYTDDTSTYLSGRNRVVNTSAVVLPPDIVDFYRQRVGFAEGLYVEYAIGSYGHGAWDPTFMTTYWKHHVYNSLVSTDRYVWCYNEDGGRSGLLNWWSDPMTNIPAGLIDATRAARAMLSAGTALGYDLCKDPGADWSVQPRVISNPTLSINAPITGVQLTTGQTLSVSLSISGSPALVRTDLIVDGHLRGSSTGVAPQFNLSDLSVGTHLLIARGFRADGDHVSSNPVRVDIVPAQQNAAPVVAATIPSQTASVGTAFNYTIPAGTFTDADGDALT
ncbi:MAG: hypothetical protein M3R04_10305, partial [bacterium]|nr:hypothetical protein [bacterium]